MRSSTLLMLVAAGAALSLGGARGLAQTFTPPPNANIVSVLDFGATPGDATDDTAAFQAALNATVSTGRVLYVPDGVYNFSDRLNWGGIGSGGFFTLQGQSQSGVILKLNDNAAGFGDAGNPRPFIDAYEGNTANQFRNYLRDVTIDIGAGNPGAIGLQFQSNNTGRIDRVTIRSSDPSRVGAVGLDQAFNFPGPMLIRDLTIEGFDTAYRGAPQEYSVVFENLTIRNQRVSGVTAWRLPLQIRNLVSENSVPVIESFSNPGAWGHVVVDGGLFTGGSSLNDAVINEDGAGVIVLRNVLTSGYRFAVNDLEAIGGAITIPDGFIAQHSTDAPASVNVSPSTIIPLPIEDAPAIPEIPVDQWVSVKTFGAIENDNLDDTAAVQAAMASGAPVVYFPSGLYYLSDTIEVGPSVVRIEGFLSQIRHNAPLATENRPMLRVGPGSQPVVHIGGLNFSFQSPGFRGGGVWLEQAAANTVVVRDGDLSYRNTVSGGKVFIENAVGTDMTFTGQKVWARQLNPEGSEFTHVINDGGDLYVLGLKTEGSSVVLENRSRARTVIMGGLIYPSTVISDRTRPMIINNESSLSMSLPESCYVTDGSYAVWVRETRGGVTTDFTRAMLPFGRGHSVCGGQIALYNGWISDASAPSVPGQPTQVSSSSNSIELSWPASDDAQSGIARYNVYRDGVFYRSSNTPSLVETGLPDGIEHVYEVSAVNGAGLESGRSPASDAATLADESQPRILSVSAGRDPRTVTVRWNEPIDPASAQTIENYAITGPAAVSVLSASLSADGTRVTLTTSPMTGGAHELSASNIADLASAPNVIDTNTRAAFLYDGSSVGGGLTGRYYTNRDFIGAPALTRVDATIDFDYGTGSAGGGLPTDNFAVRWSGSLLPRFNEPYTIFVRSDDGARVFLDGKLLISRWQDQGPTEVSAVATLDSSRAHDLVVEYYEAAGGALVQLSWSSPSQTKQIIPVANLLPTSRLTTVRTFDGAGADTTLERSSTADNGADNSMGAFHSPASGGFHDAAYFRFDLANFNLASNYTIDGVVTLSQTFFGIGDGKRMINFFGVNQAPGADSWLENGSGYVTWDTAPGNDQSGSIANPAASRLVSTFLLDNTNFQNNNQPDKAFLEGQRLLDLVNADTDGRITFLGKRVDASNEGQSWFTKEWGIPGFAPAIKLLTAPRCPQFVSGPVAPSIKAGGTVTLHAGVRGAPPMTYQWFRDGVAIADGEQGASEDGGFVSGSSDSLTSASEMVPISIRIASVQPGDAGEFTVVVTNACGTATSAAVTLAVACPSDFDNSGFVDTDDFDAFVRAFEEGVDSADFDGSGFVDTDDFDAYVLAFEAGC